MNCRRWVYGLTHQKLDQTRFIMLLI